MSDTMAFDGISDPPYALSPVAHSTEVLSSPTTRLTNGTRYAYAHPHVSFDGKWLAYSANHNRPEPDVFVQSMDGFAARQLTLGGGSNIHPVISPDSESVAFASNRDGMYRIYIVSITGVSALEEVSDPSWESISPTWAPDGRSIAFATREKAGSPWIIAVKNRDNGQQRYLTGGMYPDWSPYGDFLVFQRGDGQATGYTSLYTCRSDGSEITQVYQADDYGVVTPSWAGGGEWILFGTVNKSRVSKAMGVGFHADDIWMIKRDGTQAKLVTPHAMADWDPCYDVQNRRIVYVSNRDGAQNIYAIKSNLSPSMSGHHKLFGE